MGDGGIETDYWAPFAPDRDRTVALMGMWLGKKQRRIKRLHRWLRQYRKWLDGWTGEKYEAEIERLQAELAEAVAVQPVLIESGAAAENAECVEAIEGLIKEYGYPDSYTEALEEAINAIKGDSDG